MNLLNYLFESGAALMVFYLFYRLFLAGRSQFTMHRAFLNGGIVFSAILPLLHLTMAHGSALLGFQSVMLDPVMVSQRSSAEVLPQIPAPWMLVYYSGAAAIVVILSYRFLGIIRMRREGQVRNYSGYQLIALDKEFAPFSFFNQIFVPKSVMSQPENLTLVLTHELVHVRRLHSADNLLAGMAMAVQWFNPFVWLLHRELKKVHEYEADRNTLVQTGNHQKYVNLLFSQAFGIPYISPANHFHSSIKNRLLMLRKSNSMTDLLRGFIFIPLALALIFAFACSEEQNSADQTENQEETFEPQANQQVVQSEGSSSAPKDIEDQTFIVVEDMPVFQGEGVATFRQYIQKQLSYPDEAAEKNLEGTSYVKFIVNREGSVEDVEVIRSAHPVLDQAAVDAIKRAPDWKPGKQRGKKVNVQFTIPIVFKVSDS